MALEFTETFIVRTDPNHAVPFPTEHEAKDHARRRVSPNANDEFCEIIRVRRILDGRTEERQIARYESRHLQVSRGVSVPPTNEEIDIIYRTIQNLRMIAVADESGVVMLKDGSRFLIWRDATERVVGYCPAPVA